MDAALRELVRSRANHRCEYCRLRQQNIAGRIFHIEHIIARKHRGTDLPENLALACDQCNLHKGANLSGIDPDSGEMVRLFHPRVDVWNEHFRFVGAHIAGITSYGRATAWVLQMNSEERIELRALLMQLGEFEA